MPICTVQERSFAALKCIGHLRKGDPKPDRGPGRDLDCFRFTSDSPAVLAAFKAAYGNGTEYASELRVYLPYARLQANWDYWFETWGGKKLRYRCDGRNWVKWLLPDGNAYSREAKPCPICAGKMRPAQGEHKPTGRLALILPELLRAGHAGVVLLTTTAWSDIYSLNSCFLAVEEQRTDGRASDYRGIEFILRRELRDIPTREHGVQHKYVVVLETVAEWIQAQIAQARAETLALPAVVDPATGEILEEEEPEPEEPWASADVPEAEEPIATETTVAPAMPDLSWKDDPAKREAIQTECRRLGITKSDLVPALGCATLGEFQGGFDQLMTTLQNYAMKKKLQAA